MANHHRRFLHTSMPRVAPACSAAVVQRFVVNRRCSVPAIAPSASRASGNRLLPPRLMAFLASSYDTTSLRRETTPEGHCHFRCQENRAECERRRASLRPRQDGIGLPRTVGARGRCVADAGESATPPWVGCVGVFRQRAPWWSVAVRERHERHERHGFFCDLIALGRASHDEAEVDGCAEDVVSGALRRATPRGAMAAAERRPVEAGRCGYWHAGRPIARCGHGEARGGTTTAQRCRPRCGWATASAMRRST
uniref:Predicted protein n=1 Tax=Hordeum vulgare subsp. vulgare TaxID=112509 RepID=F2DCK4_HORVV|nr:predicted protein [Hordeum vulgare subsp. vulgare]